MWALHLAYAWLSVGFILLGLSAMLANFAQTAALHAFTSGAMATMILAVMTRATLGHTGRDLRASPTVAAVYLLATAAAIGRVAAAMTPVGFEPLIWFSTACWFGAFGLFLGVFGPMLFSPPVDKLA